MSQMSYVAIMAWTFCVHWLMWVWKTDRANSEKKSQTMTSLKVLFIDTLWNHNQIVHIHCNASSFPLLSILTTVIVEAVKCLCNIFLNNKHLISKSSELGIVRGLSERLSLHYKNSLPYEVVYFDLRLLFLITACDSNERWISIITKLIKRLRIKE